MLYKQRINTIIAQKRKSGTRFTLSAIAATLNIEPSYLSRFLGYSQVHFSDDLLFRLLAELNMNGEETDYIFMLKEYDRSEHPKRKLYLRAKIKSHHLSRWKNDLAQFKEQISELLELIGKVDL